MNPVYGKHRGLVIDNSDPLLLGRVRASVPSIGIDDTSWALPASPYAGDQVGLFFIPPIGAQVWVEFEAGNTSFPIWSGGFWTQGQVPAEAAQAPPDVKVIKTAAATIIIDDDQEQVTIQLNQTQVQIVLDATGVKTNNGSGLT